MKKNEVSEQFIRETFEAVCETWKGKIKKEFPELFEVKMEKNKWYKCQERGNLVFYCSDEQKNYGISFAMLRWDNELWVHKGYTWILATKEEIETMLWKEAEERGIRKDTKLEESLYFCQNSKNEGSFRVGYSENMDRLWNIHGVIYEKGKWATPLNENKEIQDKIDSLQKQLDELKLKVK